MNISTIAASELDRYVGRKDVIIVDVREVQAFNYKHFKGAINIPVREMEKVALDSSKEIILYCERGAASLKAAAFLAKRGYKVKSVVGGINAYKGSFLS